MLIKLAYRSWIGKRKKLEDRVLDLSCIRFNTDPDLHISPDVHVEHSYETLEKIAQTELIPLTTLDQWIERADIIQKLAIYLACQRGEYQKRQALVLTLEEMIDLILVCSFFHMHPATLTPTPAAVQTAWHEYISCIHTLSEWDLPPEQSKTWHIYAQLSHAFSTYKTLQRCVVISLEQLWRTPPDQGFSLFHESMKIQLQFQEGFWYYFDLNGDMTTCLVFSQGNEASLQKLLAQKFTDQAIYVATLQPLNIDLNPCLTPDAVVAYIKKKHGLEYVLRSTNALQLLSYIQIDSLQLEDFAPLLENDFYQTAVHYQPKFIRRMLERYHTLNPTFVLPAASRRASDRYTPHFSDTVNELNEQPSRSGVSAKRTSITSSPRPLAKWTAKKLTPAKYSQHSAYKPHHLPSDLRDAQHWLQREGTTEVSHRLLLEKLQDYLVLQHGMSETVWTVLNTLEAGGIEIAIAYSYADYWADPDVDDPAQLIFGWKDACTALQYWKGAERQIPPVGSKLYRMLHILWYYSYHMYADTPQAPPYAYRRTVPDLTALLRQRPEQPLVLSDEHHAVTCLFRGGIWYFFNPNTTTSEPEYIRCGSEQSLHASIVKILTGNLKLATRQPLAHPIGEEIPVQGLGKFPEMIAPEWIGMPRFKLRDPDPSKTTNKPAEPQLEDLFPPTVIGDEEHTVSADDPNLSFLCECSLDVVALRPPSVAVTQQKDASERPISLTAFDLKVLGREGENILLQCSNEKQLAAYLDHLLTTPQAKSRGLWIVNRIRDLQCDVKNVIIHPDNHCEELEAPAGECFQFLQAHEAPIIAVNISALTTNEIVQINPLWDDVDHRTIDKVSVPKRALVLSIQNMRDPNAYLGKDFTSRQDGKPIKIPDNLMIPDILEALTLDQNTPESSELSHGKQQDSAYSEQVELELYHSLHWKHYLYGKLDPAPTGVIFEPTALLARRAYAESLQIVLHNALTELPEFRQALYTLWQSRHVEYHGLTTTLPLTLSLRFSEGYTFEWTHAPPQFTYQDQDEYDYVLNPSTLTQFFRCYSFVTNGVVTLPGIIAMHAGAPLTLYVSRGLLIEEWAKLLH